MSEPYSNREIDLLFKGFEEREEGRHREKMSKLESILEQTRKTNGRVDKLEDRTDSMDRKIYAFSTLSALVAVPVINFLADRLGMR